MSRAIQNSHHHRHPYEEWGPDHQYMRAPWHPERERRHPVWRFVGWFLAAMFLHTIIDSGGSVATEPTWCLTVMFWGWLLKKLVVAIKEDRVPVDWLVRLGRGIASWVLIQFASKAPLALLERIPAFNTNYDTAYPEEQVSSIPSATEPSLATPESPKWLPGQGLAARKQDAREQSVRSGRASG